MRHIAMFILINNQLATICKVSICNNEICFTFSVAFDINNYAKHTTTSCHTTCLDLLIYIYIIMCKNIKVMSYIEKTNLLYIR